MPAPKYAIPACASRMRALGPVERSGGHVRACPAQRKSGIAFIRAIAADARSPIGSRSRWNSAITENIASPV